MKDSSRLIGVIYPLPDSILNRIFQDNRNIFVKFTTHDLTTKTKLRIRNGVRVFLYQSGSGRIVVGEGEISNFEYLKKMIFSGDTKVN